MEGMSNEQWAWHPPGKWCAAEVLEHLYLTYTGTIEGFERVMTSWKATGLATLHDASRAKLGRRGLGSHARRSQSTCGGGAERLAGGNRAK